MLLLIQNLHFIVHDSSGYTILRKEIYAYSKKGSQEDPERVETIGRCEEEGA